MLFYLLQTIVVTTILLTHTLSYPAEHKKEVAPEVNADDYKRKKTAELQEMLMKAKEEDSASIIRKFVEQNTINATWGLPLRRAVELAAKHNTKENMDLVRFLIEQRANVHHGAWGERIAHPLYRPGYTEEPTLTLAGDNQELLKILR